MAQGDYRRGVRGAVQMFSDMSEADAIRRESESDEPVRGSGS